uniref:SECRETED 45 kDa PROTEIN CYCLE, PEPTIDOGLYCAN, CHAP, CELL n=1 Tax=Siphoviridae sp. ctgu013 TaxID=2826421 RepID=A0A8S5NI18_9CAUD|nr:MAG TPA: SECRETED 45 KDA PROTEIN CYCLE, PEPTIDOGLYCAN, CHAP, CELL [Siphoviridae sp. ctgu013]
MKTKKDLSVPVLLSALLFCAFLPGLQVLAEEMYQISETELTQLEANLNQLEKNNETKQQLLTEQKTQLTEASQQLETVKKELTASKSLNEATRKSLARANQSLRQFEDEAKRKIRVKTRQRNLWIAISGGLLYAWIKK